MVVKANKRINGDPVYYERIGEGADVFVCYSQFDVGNKYKVRRRNRNEYGTRFMYSTDSYTEAVRYADKVFIGKEIK